MTASLPLVDGQRDVGTDGAACRSEEVVKCCCEETQREMPSCA